MDDLEKYKDLMNHQDSEAQDELADFLRKSSQATAPFKRSKDELWSAIESAVDNPKGEKTGKLIPIWGYISIAAAIALIITFSILFGNREQAIQVLAHLGETKTEVLPDGSKVTINASSRLDYVEGQHRKLTLEGEAFFEVTAGDPFVVNTPSGSVEVLGTSFNVFARENDFEVSCKTGQVRVTIPSKSFSKIITAGEIIGLRADTIRQITRLPDMVGKWQAGEFYFDDQPITEVFMEMQRQFEIGIEYEASEEQNFSGYFTNKSIESALEMVCLPLGLTYKKIGQNTFAISKATQ